MPADMFISQRPLREHRVMAIYIFLREASVFARSSKMSYSRASERRASKSTSSHAFLVLYGFLESEAEFQNNEKQQERRIAVTSPIL